MNSPKDKWATDTSSWFTKDELQSADKNVGKKVHFTYNRNSKNADNEIFFL